MSYAAAMAADRARLEKAQKRVDRWQAVVRFTKWLKGSRPELFAELETKLW